MGTRQPALGPGSHVIPTDHRVERPVRTDDAPADERPHEAVQEVEVVAHFRPETHGVRSRISDLYRSRTKPDHDGRSRSCGQMGASLQADR